MQEPPSSAFTLLPIARQSDELSLHKHRAFPGASAHFSSGPGFRYALTALVSKSFNT